MEEREPTPREMLRDLYGVTDEQLDALLNGERVYTYNGRMNPESKTHWLSGVPIRRLKRLRRIAPSTRKMKLPKWARGKR